MLDSMQTNDPFKNIGSHTLVPLTVEERRRRLLVRVSAIAIVVVSLAVITTVSILFIKKISLEKAIHKATATGEINDLKAVLSQITSTGPDAIAQRARWQSQLVFGGHEKPDATVALLNTLPTDAASNPSTAIHHLIATTYLKISEGKWEEAWQILAVISPQGTDAYDLAYLRALVGVQMEQYQDAEKATEVALQLNPGPRIYALRALIHHLTHRSKERDEMIKTIESETGVAGKETARALLVQFAALDHIHAPTALADAKALETSVLLSSQAKGWGKLLLAQHAVSEGQSLDAVNHLQSIFELKSDAMLRLEVKKVFAELLYLQTASALSATPNTQRAQQAQLKILTASRSFTSASTLAEALPLCTDATAATANTACAENTLLRGQLLLATGKPEAAASLFSIAKGHLGFKNAALAGEALSSSSKKETAFAMLSGNSLQETKAKILIALEHQDIATALDLSGGALQNTPAILVLRARAFELSDQLAQARTALASAQQPQATADLEFQAAYARIMTKPTRADLLFQPTPLTLDAKATTAIETVLKEHPHSRDALFAHIQHHMAARTPQTAETSLSMLEADGWRDVEFERLRAFHAVTMGWGASWLPDAQKAARTYKRDTDLRFAIGYLFFQSEKYSDAAGTLASIANEELHYPETLLLRGLACGWARAKRCAEDMFELLAVEKQKGWDKHNDALVLAIHSALEWQDDNAAAASHPARQALQLWESEPNTNLIMAEIKSANGEDETKYLDLALKAYPPLTRAWARAAIGGEPTPERCEFTQRYRRAAPRGAYLKPIGERTKSCR